MCFQATLSSKFTVWSECRHKRWYKEKNKTIYSTFSHRIFFLYCYILHILLPTRMQSTNVDQWPLHFLHIYANFFTCSSNKPVSRLAFHCINTKRNVVLCNITFIKYLNFFYHCPSAYWKSSNGLSKSRNLLVNSHTNNSNFIIHCY